MRKSAVTFLVLSILLVSLLASSLPGATFAPRNPASGKSRNWAGYAVLTSLTSPQKAVVSDVKGSWVVPWVDCSTTQQAYSSFWIGMDGSSTVEQVGTESDCASGSPRYYAWYEMYPKYAVNLKMKIAPGDMMSAEVQYLGESSFKLTITDTTTGATFTTTQKSSRAQRLSAEWIAEAPWSIRVLPLANFGTVTFQNAEVIINGHTGTINEPAWQFDKIDMVSSSGSAKATTLDLNAGGTSFSVKWVSAR